MTDRPALAEAIVEALKAWQCETYSVPIKDTLSVDVIERVLAEHEPAQAKGAIETMRDGEDLVVVERKGYEKLQAAEARCAQLEAEHERLRAALGQAKAALIQARGALRLDAMVDEAGKPYGTTVVALDAIDTALALAQELKP